MPISSGHSAWDSNKDPWHLNGTMLFTERGDLPTGSKGRRWWCSPMSIPRNTLGLFRMKLVQTNSLFPYRTIHCVAGKKWLHIQAQHQWQQVPRETLGRWPPSRQTWIFTEKHFLTLEAKREWGEQVTCALRENLQCRWCSVQHVPGCLLSFSTDFWTLPPHLTSGHFSLLHL